ncbi:MAG: hypothetical protein ABSA39_04170 [Edaphobacter sp.]
MRSLFLSASLLVLSLPLLATSAVALAQDASSPTPAPTTVQQNTAYDWVASGKKNEDDIAKIASTTQNEHLEIYFFKHEFGSLMVRIPATVAIKEHSKDPFKQMKKNKIEVQVALDDAAPVSQTWAVVEYPKEAVLPALAPEDRSPKLYQKALESKKLTISYPDATGNTKTVVFDLSAMKSQMDAHKEKVHHFGVKDGLGILGAMAAGMGE